MANCRLLVEEEKDNEADQDETCIDLTFCMFDEIVVV
jgi:hypothetical protein